MRPIPRELLCRIDHRDNLKPIADWRPTYPARERGAALNLRRLSRACRDQVPGGPGNLACQVRRQLDLGAVVQVRPVDVAARRRGVLLDHPFGLGKLRRIPREPAGWRGALHPAPSESRGEMARLRSARVFVSASVVRGSRPAVRQGQSRSLGFNPSGGIDPDQPLVTTSIGATPAVNGTSLTPS
jgi:hypothetical protein